ncbi:hypothetical protein BU16DRAFT_556839 [Lophium mytilinum]|uniref:Uncharacterized protein n=1 Tax=Lophium mytilinum TaxID=390894 RepID=A0A6A6R702_9PEZI|nr:hypothetical protein BU16DRAFT_556839 [Lophium mytilinum]
MEALSGVASAFAVVSLSIQLVDNINTLCEFWEKVRGAPKYIKELVQELRLLRSVSTQVDSLMAIMAKVQGGLSSGSRIVRTWNSFKVSLKGRQIMQFRLSLSETKSTLILARFSLSEKIHYRIAEQTMTALTDGLASLSVHRASGTVMTEIHDSLDMQGHIASLQAEMRHVTASVPQSWIRSGMQVALDNAVRGMADKLDVQDPVPPKDQGGSDTRRGRTATPSGYSGSHPDVESGQDASARLESDSRNRRNRRLGTDSFHGSYSSITSSVFGTIYLSTDKFYIDDPTFTDDSDEEGAHLGRILYRTFHAVPDNALIFEFCKQGNLMAVNSLLVNGQASPWDTNSKGWTPLHFASWNCDLALMKTLVRAGADRTALTFDFPSGNYEHCSPLVTAATITSVIEVSPQRRIEALRLLLDDSDFSDHEGQA